MEESLRAVLGSVTDSRWECNRIVGLGIHSQRGNSLSLRFSVEADRVRVIAQALGHGFQALGELLGSDVVVEERTHGVAELVLQF